MSGFNASPLSVEFLEDFEVISGQTSPQYLGDFGATLGGPLVKDKLWFFAGGVPALSRYQHTRTVKDVNTGMPIPGSSRSYFLEQRGLQAMGKLMEGAFPSERRYTPNQTQTNREPVDPAILPTSSTELVAGAEYEVLPSTRLSAHYSHRQLDSAIEDMSRDEGQSYFLGNPGLGSASDFPKAERTHDAVSVVLSRTFREGWLAQASYTWSRLYGNYVGPFSGGLVDFNIFNFQQVTRVDENYTYASVLPVKAGTPGGLPGAVYNLDTNSALAESDVNGNFKQPLQYQLPRQVRLGLRYAF